MHVMKSTIARGTAAPVKAFVFVCLVKFAKDASDLSLHDAHIVDNRSQKHVTREKWTTHQSYRVKKRSTTPEESRR